MKKYIKILFIFSATILIMGSCENYLNDYEPQQSLSVEQAFNAPSDVEAAVNGIYSAMQTDAYYGRLYPTVPEILIGNLASTTTTTRDITFMSEQNSIFPANNSLEDIYWRIYETINRSNSIIEFIDMVEGGWAEGQKDLFLGQAYFARALGHFDALRAFGEFDDLNSTLGIVIKTEPSTLSNVDAPRNTVNEVYSQILKDLEEAIQLMPTRTALEEPWQASSTAATALLARVYLYMGEDAKAAEAATTVIDELGALPEPYGDIFNAVENYSNEHIFSLWFDQIDGNDMAFFHFPVSESGRGDYGPTQFIIDEYTETASNGDVRKDAVLAESDDGEIFVYKYKNLAGANPVYVLRLAEMYLIRAEATMGSQQATDDINAVRSRAGLSDLEGQATISDLQQEKMLELAFEGHRWFDNIRWGTAVGAKPSITEDTPLYMPIPQEEVDANNEIEQSPGY